MADQSIAAARILVQLDDARKTAQRLFGTEYAAKVAPWRELVRKLAAEWKCNALAVPPRLSRNGDMPENPLLLLAAVLDEAEEKR